MFLKVPNAVFNQGIKGNALKIYLYLLSCQNRLGTATVRVATIQEKCAIDSPDTVRAALDLLEDKGLLHKSHRKNYDGNFIASRFDLTQLHGSWFAVDMAIHPFRLDKSAFAVYLFLLKNRRVGRSGSQACPSLFALVHALSLAKNTILSALNVLAQLGLVIKAALWAGKHNLYMLVQKCFSTKKVAAPESLTTISEERRTSLNTTCKIPRSKRIVNSFAAFFVRVVQKIGISIKTYLLPNKKKKQSHTKLKRE